MAQVGKQSEMAEGDLTAMGEAEVDRLKRTLRIMEQERRAYTEECKQILGGQIRVLNILKKERDRLNNDLGVAESPLKMKQDATTNKKLNTLLDKQAMYSYKIENEKQQIKELSTQVLKIERQIMQQRRALSSVQKGQQSEKFVENQIQILEGRLNNVKQIFNTTMAENNQLREEIDHLLKGRQRFNRLYDQMTRDLRKGKRLMTELVEKTSQAYQQREEAQGKMLVLKERCNRDIQNHMGEMRELDRLLEHNKELFSFLQAKAQERQPIENKEQLEWEREQQRERKRREAMIKYEETFSEIRELFNEDNLDKLVQQYKQTEEENFAMFNYVNQLNIEAEGLKDEIEQLKKQIQEQKGKDDRMEYTQKRHILKWRKELARSTAEALRMRHRVKEAHEILVKLRNGVLDLFDSAGCSNEPLLKLLGRNETITNDNVLLYLGILEEHVINMVNLMNYIEKERASEPDEKPSDAGGLPVGKGKPVVASHKFPSILPPSTREALEDEYEMKVGAKPLKHNDMKKHLGDKIINIKYDEDQTGKSWDL